MQEDILNAPGTTPFAACYRKKFSRTYSNQTLLFLAFALAPSLLRREIWQVNQGGGRERMTT